jgi:glycosyltransferase involved in cell wall biosynthesis
MDMISSAKPKVSVIIPNYNHARFLRKRVDSVLRQTLSDFELILLDDCSTDDSCSILSSYANDRRVRIEVNSSNSGNTFHQWNKGVRLARGKYVWIAESDDYADERMLQRLVAILEGEARVAFAYCRSWCVSEDDRLEGFLDRYIAYIDSRRWTKDFLADGQEECRNYFLRTNPVANASAVVFRRDLYDRVGGADESLRLCGDWKLWAALALAGQVAYLGEPMNYFRFHDASVRNKSKLVKQDLVEHLRVVAWILDKAAPTESMLTKVRESKSELWVPLVMSTHVPFSVKWDVLRAVRKLDPHPIRRALHPALNTIRLKFARHFSFARHS